MIGQVKDEFEVKEPLLQRYYHTVCNNMAWFQRATLEHIRQQENKCVDTLPRLSTTKKKIHHRSVMQVWMRQPSVAKAECLAVTNEKNETWMTPIIQYLEHDTCKSEEEKAMKQQCSRYTLINQDLYRRGYSTPLLKCITKDQVEYVLKEIHKGYVTIIRALGRWLLKSSRLVIIGRPTREVAQNM